MDRSITDVSQLSRLCPAAFYRPNTAAPQEMIDKWGGMPGSKSTGDQPWFESDAQLRISVGGNRAGKTTKLVLESGSTCVGVRPWYPPDNHWHTRGLRTVASRDRGYARVRYVVPSFSQHLPEVIKEFKKWWPQNWWKIDQRDAGGIPRAIRFFNGSEILFMSHHMRDEDFEGIESDLNAWDEPPPQNVWVALERGVVSTGGRTIVGATLLDAAGWFWDEVLVHGETPGTEKAIKVTWHSIWDNTAENGGCRSQTVENVHNWLQYKIADSDERLAREHGHPLHVGGLVLSGINERINIIDPFELPSDCIIVGAIDPAGTRPMAGLHAAFFMKEGNWEGHFFDETFIPNQRTDLASFCELWEAKESGKTNPEHPARSTVNIIDPFSEETQKADQFGRSLRRIIDEDYGIRTELANRSGKRARLLRLNARFKDARYFIWRNCKRFNLERRRWSWEQGKAKLTSGPDDMCDCASYIDVVNPHTMLGEMGGTEDGIYVPNRYEDPTRGRMKIPEESLVQFREPTLGRTASRLYR